MASVSTNIKIDAELKKEAQVLFEKLGLNLSTAVNIFLRQAVREQGIPFYVNAEEPNQETREAIEEVQRMKCDPNLGRTYTDVDEMMRELLA